MTALPATIPHAAEAAARRWGDNLALIEGSARFTFAELWDECRRAASARSQSCISWVIASGDPVRRANTE